MKSNKLMNTEFYAKNTFNQESGSEDLNPHSVLNLQSMNKSFKISQFNFVSQNFIEPFDLKSDT